MVDSAQSKSILKTLVPFMFALIVMGATGLEQWAEFRDRLDNQTMQEQHLEAEIQRVNDKLDRLLIEGRNNGTR